MQSFCRHAAIALFVIAGTGAADAQQWVYETDAAATAPLRLTTAQRTIIYRTIIPQGRGRGPIVRERIVTERAPAVRERAVVPDDSYASVAEDSYALDVYGDRREWIPAPRESRRVVEVPAERDYAYAVGTRVPETMRLAPLPRRVVAEVPRLRDYRYIRYHDRVLVIDPATSTVVAEVAGYY